MKQFSQTTSVFPWNNTDPIRYNHKRLFHPATQVSPGAPDHFHSSKSLSRSRVIQARPRFTYTDYSNTKEIFDLNSVKPSVAIDIASLNRLDAKLRSPFYTSFSKHLAERGFSRPQGLFSKHANSPLIGRANTDALRKSQHSLNWYTRSLIRRVA